LKVRAGDTGSKCRQLISLIYAIQATHAAEINSQDRLIAWKGIDVSDDAGSPTIWDHSGAGRTRILNQVSYLALTFRVGNAVGKRFKTPTAQGNPIGQALSACVAYPLGGISGDERVRGEPSRRHLCDNFFEWS